MLMKVDLPLSKVVVPITLDVLLEINLGIFQIDIFIVKEVNVS